MYLRLQNNTTSYITGIRVSSLWGKRSRCVLGSLREVEHFKRWNCNLLTSDAVYSWRWLPTLQRNMSLPC